MIHATNPLRKTFIRSENEEVIKVKQEIDHTRRLTKGDLARLTSQQRGYKKEDVGKYAQEIQERRIKLNNHGQLKSIT